MSLNKDSLKQLKEYMTGSKVLIVGIGNTLHRDDAAGVLLVNELKSKIKNNPGIQFINAGMSPENHTRKIVDSNSGVIILLDIVRMNKPAGTIEVFGPNQVKDTTSSTHNISIKLFVEYLSSRTAAKIFLIGIEPETTEFGEGISEPVKESMKLVESELLKLCMN